MELFMGNAFEIGFETQTVFMENITFKNGNLIYVERPQGTFIVHNGDCAVIKDVRYEYIRIEDGRGWLIDFKIEDLRYSKNLKRRGIENIKFKNITLEAENFPYSQPLGYNEEHLIKMWKLIIF
jgi:hypothetical protein